jgi:hypothetical protein
MRWFILLALGATVLIVRRAGSFAPSGLAADQQPVVATGVAVSTDSGSAGATATAAAAAAPQQADAEATAAKADSRRAADEPDGAAGSAKRRKVVFDNTVNIMDYKAPEYATPEARATWDKEVAATMSEVSNFNLGGPPLRKFIGMKVRWPASIAAILHRETTSGVWHV